MNYLTIKNGFPAVLLLNRPRIQMIYVTFCCADAPKREKFKITYVFRFCHKVIQTFS